MEVYIVQHWDVANGTDIVIGAFSDESSAREFANVERAKLSDKRRLFSEGVSLVVHTLDFHTPRLFNE